MPQLDLRLWITMQLFFSEKVSRFGVAIHRKVIYMYLPKNFDQTGENVDVNTLPAFSNRYFTFVVSIVQIN
jgi:hypothetical protein